MTMIDEEVAAPVLITKFITVRIPTILMLVEVAVPVVLTDEVPHILDFFLITISWNKICFCLH